MSILKATKKKNEGEEEEQGTRVHHQIDVDSLNTNANPSAHASMEANTTVTTMKGEGVEGGELIIDQKELLNEEPLIPGKELESLPIPDQEPISLILDTSLIVDDAPLSP